MKIKNQSKKNINMCNLYSIKVKNDLMKKPANQKYFLYTYREHATTQTQHMGLMMDWRLQTFEMSGV